MQNLVYDGLWWVPNNNTSIKRVPGEFTFNCEDGLHLELQGVFESVAAGGRLPTGRRYEVIHGIIDNGKPITLCNNILTNSYRGGLSRDKYLSGWAIVGGHYQNLDSIRVESALVSFTYLRDWTQRHGTAHLDAEEMKRLQADTGFVYKRPEDIQAVANNIDFSVLNGYETEYSLRDGAYIKENANIQVALNESMPFWEFISRVVHPLLFFITLATDMPNSILEIEFGDGNCDKDKWPYPMNAVFQDFYRRKQPEAFIFEHKMLFTLKDVADDLSAVLTNWFSSIDELDSVVDLFFNVRHNSGMRPNQVFLSLVQALESYHRRRISNRVWTDEEFQKRKAEVIAASPEYADWLKDILSFTNEPRLHQRLEDLFNAFQDILLPLVADRSKFITKIKNTRNYLTHYDTRLKKRAFSEGELPSVNRTLMYLLKACLLKEIGFSMEKCVELFGRNSTYNLARRPGDEIEAKS